MAQFKNYQDLEQAINQAIYNALQETRNKIFDELFASVTAYYNEPVFDEPNRSKPHSYRRTNKLKDSLTHSEIINDNGRMYFTVGWEDDYLQFSYPGCPKWSGNVLATGEKVLEWFDSRSHGGTVNGEHEYWREAMDRLGGESGIEEIFLDALKNEGIELK